MNTEDAVMAVDVIELISLPNERYAHIDGDEIEIDQTIGCYWDGKTGRSRLEIGKTKFSWYANIGEGVVCFDGLISDIFKLLIDERNRQKVDK